MQNPSAPDAAAAGKSKSSAQAAAAASGPSPSPATPAAAKPKSSSQAAAGAHSSPATPATGKSKSSAHAALSAQASSSHHHHHSGGGGTDASLKRKRGVFQKDLQHMMYGFGDDPNPLPETVALVEDIVVEYVTDLVHKAQNVASKRGKLLTEDFLYLVRKIERRAPSYVEKSCEHRQLPKIVQMTSEVSFKGFESATNMFSPVAT